MAKVLALILLFEFSCSIAWARANTDANNKDSNKSYSEWRNKKEKGAPSIKIIKKIIEKCEINYENQEVYDNSLNVTFNAHNSGKPDSQAYKLNGLQYKGSYDYEYTFRYTDIYYNHPSQREWQQGGGRFEFDVINGILTTYPYELGGCFTTSNLNTNNLEIFCKKDCGKEKPENDNPNLTPKKVPTYLRQRECLKDKSFQECIN